MSKQSDAKALQNYTEKPFVKMCGNCKHFTFESVVSHTTWSGNVYMKEMNLRCSIGGFKVKKTAVCQDWEAKP